MVYLAYRATLQAQALTLVAKKLKASLAVEGDLGDDGLSTFGDDGEDLLMALARSLTEQVGANDESLEGLFAEFREASQSLEGSLDAQEPWANARESGEEPALVEVGAHRQSHHAACDLAKPSMPRLIQGREGSEQLRLF